ncbi:MAG: alpha/beta hydrolase [Candidatus Levybacteria bacterium]|nr:alpha/beta hydrolase [Candidatus Levybacteria bacterium]
MILTIEHKVKIKNRFREALIGVEVLPEEKRGKYPVVIMVHGFAYYKEEDGIFVEIGERLAEIGIASYRFDFSGCGESEGDYSDTTLTKLRDDLETILEYVKLRPSTDTNRIGILAQSFGTTTTIALAPQVNGIILMGSFMNGKKVLADLFGEGYNPEERSVRVDSDGSKTEMDPPFWKDFDNHDMKALLKRINCPLLLIHGSLDDHVPLSEMEEIYANANEPKEKVIIDGAYHSLEPKREEVYRKVVDWFKKTLKNSSK